jgi:hypothetical protein
MGTVQGGVGGEPGCGGVYAPAGGELVIDGQVELDELIGVTVFQGRLEIRDAVDLSPLACLTRVEGTLSISGNSLLTTLSGLEQLTEIDGACVIVENPSLSKIEALGSVRSILGDLNVEDNAVLPTCQAERLVEAIGSANIGGMISIDGNDDQGMCPDGPRCGGDYVVPTGRDSWVDSQEKLETLRGYTQIIGSEFAIDGVRDLSPLECLTRLDVGNTEIWYLDATDAHGLERLTEVTGAFGFAGFTESLRGLDSLTRVGLELWFSGPRFRDLSGLESLVEVGGTLMLPVAELENIEALANVERLGGLRLEGTQVQTLAGLEKLVQISGDSKLDFGHLRLLRNRSLRNLRALANLIYVSGDLVIEDNPSLPQCEAEWLVNSLTAQYGIGGEIIITGTSSAACDEP